jgi:hypothetical protein
LPVAHLQFERNGEIVSVFAYRRQESGRSPIRCKDVAGGRFCVRQAAGKALVVAASRAETASEFAPVVRAAAR